MTNPPIDKVYFAKQNAMNSDDVWQKESESVFEINRESIITLLNK